MPNLDRFSQPLHGETYFEDEKPVCQCEDPDCGNELYEGEWHFETDDHHFCDVDCFTNWAKIEFDGRSRILERKE